MGLIDPMRVKEIKEVAEKKFRKSRVLKDFLGWPWVHDDQFVSQVVCYTDGAASMGSTYPREPLSAGWAAVFFVQRDGHRAMLGAMFAPVVVDPSSPLFFGSERPTNAIAELVAVIASLHLFRRVLPSAPSSVDFFVGATYVEAALALKAAANKNRSLVRVGRVELGAAKLGGEVRFHHVAGHSGVAENEMADLCAVWARHGGTTMPPLSWQEIDVQVPQSRGQ